MASDTRFDHGKPQLYFSAGFTKNHIHVGSAADKLSKKKAENAFMRRAVTINTVLCLTRQELVQLAGEIHRRQEGARPRTVYTTDNEYSYWQRGGDKAKDRQRATCHSGKLKYSVREEHGRYVCCHLDGMV